MRTRACEGVRSEKESNERSTTTTMVTVVAGATPVTLPTKEKEQWEII
jgi:hypothetical protein